jgi:hypothetical protein
MVSVHVTKKYQRCPPELNHYKKYMRKIIRVLQQFWHHHLATSLSKIGHKALPEARR